MSVVVLKLDPYNNQQEYMYMAKTKNNRKNDYVVGYLVIQKPWYSPESEWKYYIFRDKNINGICGGMETIGFEQTEVDKDTIEPYTQTAEIKLNQYRNMNTRLVVGDEHTGIVIDISPTDEIPYDIYFSDLDKALFDKAEELGIELVEE